MKQREIYDEREEEREEAYNEGYQQGRTDIIDELVSEVRRLEGKCRAPYHDYHCEIQCLQCEWDSIPRKMVLDMLNELKEQRS